MSWEGVQAKLSHAQVCGTPLLANVHVHLIHEFIDQYEIMFKKVGSFQRVMVGWNNSIQYHIAIRKRVYGAKLSLKMLTVIILYLHLILIN